MTECITFTEQDARDCLSVFPRQRKYQVLYADPPWRYESDGNLAVKPYPTMSLEELKRLPVRDVAADDSAMFMWTSNPLMEKALELMRAWGFTYKTIFKVWTKRTQSGAPARLPGYWSMSSTEMLLVGTRGAMQKYKRVFDESQEVSAERGPHSQKPACVRDGIARLLEVDRRLELFARHVVQGWDAWGLDIPGFVHCEGLAAGALHSQRATALLLVSEPAAADTSGGAEAGLPVRLVLRWDSVTTRGANTDRLTMRRPNIVGPAPQRCHAQTPKSASTAPTAPKNGAQTRDPPPPRPQQAPARPHRSTRAVSDQQQQQQQQQQKPVAAHHPKPNSKPAVAVESAADAADGDMRRNFDRVPILRGEVIVRGPAKPTRVNFARWLSQVHKETGLRNSEVYKVDDAYLAANPDVREMLRLALQRAAGV